MILYPAIDLRNGNCVQLIQGKTDQEIVYFENPVEPAQLWRDAGAQWVHIVDLDGAFTGDPKNWQVIEKIAAIDMKVQMGGGLRDVKTVEKAFALGVSRVVIGTKACEDENFIKQLVEKFGHKIAVGIDAINGRVATQGWVNTTELDALDFAGTISDLGVQTIIYTDISRDGMLTGPNIDGQEKILAAVNVNIIASGGITSYEDIDHYINLKDQYPRLEGIIIGKALYEKKIDLSEALRR